MAASNTNTLQGPPSVFKAIKGGFDAIANQIYIVLIPILFDLWLWLGPHLQVKRLMTDILAMLNSTPSLEVSSSESIMLVNSELIKDYIERINLMTTLRSYPVGIPSLISSILPIQTPLGTPQLIDITSPWMVILIWLAFILLGTLAGTFYFMVVSQAALEGRVRIKQSMVDYPRMAIQMLGLTLAIGLVLLILIVPISCVFSFISLGGIPVTQITLIVLLGMLLWLIFPLIFTPFGIFAGRVNILAAVQRSILLTRMTLPNTLMFLVVMIIASQGLDFLWRVPQENSWLALVGVAGHAFVASGLLATAFVYYRDADAWVQRIIQGMYTKQLS